MQIRKTSLIHRYYLFLRKLLNSFYQKSEYSQSDPFNHYVFFHKINWCKKLYCKLRIDQSHLHVKDDLLATLKILINRLVLYQLWGSFAIAIVLTILDRFLSISVPFSFYIILIGAIPIFHLILIVGIFGSCIDYMKAFIAVINGSFKDTKQKRSNIHIIHYISFIIFTPFIAFGIIFLEILARCFVSFAHYQAIGVKLFIEFVWLSINFLWLIGLKLFLIIYRKIKLIFTWFMDHKKQNKRNFYLEIQE